MVLAPPGADAPAPGGSPTKVLPQRMQSRALDDLFDDDDEEESPVRAGSAVGTYSSAEKQRITDSDTHGAKTPQYCECFPWDTWKTHRGVTRLE